MRKRLSRADKKLIIPGGDASPSDDIILPGKDTEAGGDDPTVVLQETQTSIPTIDATTLADEHQSAKDIQRELDRDPDSEDWGGGFMAFPEPAHILRGPDGNIVSVVPLSEIPGVELSMQAEEKIEAIQGKQREELVTLNRGDRHKLVSVIATRLYRYYEQLARDYAGYHPFRDGIPEYPKGAPKNLSPDLNDCYPATDAQIYQWIYAFVGQRATVINKNRFGSGYQDMALRIE